MCGRYGSSPDSERIEAAAGTQSWRGKERFRPGAIASPTTNNPVVVRNAEGGKTLHVMRWGLIPFWTKDPKSLPTLMFNARGESVAEKPAFRTALSSGKRCIAIANGFFEWYKGKDPKYASPSGLASQPYLVTHADGSLMKMAGLYDVWKMGEEVVYSYTILTLSSEDTSLAWLHDRVPAVLSDEDAEVWLDTENVNASDAMKRCIRPFKGELLTIKMENNLHTPISDKKRPPTIAAAFAKVVPKPKPPPPPAADEEQPLCDDHRTKEELQKDRGDGKERRAEDAEEKGGVRWETDLLTPESKPSHAELMKASTSPVGKRKDFKESAEQELELAKRQRPSHPPPSHKVEPATKHKLSKTSEKERGTAKRQRSVDSFFTRTPKHR